MLLPLLLLCRHHHRLCCCFAAAVVAAAARLPQPQPFTLTWSPLWLLLLLLLRSLLLLLPLAFFAQAAGIAMSPLLDSAECGLMSLVRWRLIRLQNGDS